MRQDSQRERRAWQEGFAAGEKAALRGAPTEMLQTALAGASAETFEIATLFNRSPPEMRAGLRDAIARVINAYLASHAETALVSLPATPLEPKQPQEPGQLAQVIQLADRRPPC